jgi:type 1 glutamine amidotransferase
VKDVITEGDLPVVWANTKYRMLYINMGHGPAVYADATQNKLLANAILWLGRKK